MLLSHDTALLPALFTTSVCDVQSHDTRYKLPEIWFQLVFAVALCSVGVKGSNSVASSWQEAEEDHFHRKRKCCLRCEMFVLLRRAPFALHFVRRQSWREKLTAKRKHKRQQQPQALETI